MLGYPETYLDYPFGDRVAVYKVRLKENDHKMFALVAEQKGILRLSLKCDPLLARTLRDKYESVLPGYHLPKKHWNTVVLTGQLDWQEIVALIDHSYQLVSGR